jgi:hypothetical protein
MDEENPHYEADNEDLPDRQSVDQSWDQRTQALSGQTRPDSILSRRSVKSQNSASDDRPGSSQSSNSVSFRSSTASSSHSKILEVEQAPESARFVQFV